MRFFDRPYAYAKLFAVFLTLLTAFCLLDTFVLPQGYGAAATPAAPAQTPDAVQTADQTGPPDPTPTPFVKVVTEDRYDDGSISVSITSMREYGTDIYVADVTLSSAAYLKTALAKDTFGVNIRETTSAMAERTGAILAVNGDYYGANKAGFVLKNGVLYRGNVRRRSGGEDLVIYQDGSFGIIVEKDTDPDTLVAAGVTQLLAFGPALVEDGLITVGKDSEVSVSTTNNPRTAIGIIAPLHYVFVVSDGRSASNQGLSLYELSEVLASLGCVTGYNLDGGGSSTMVFNGKLVNSPTTNGKKIVERSVSDIVYIGY